MLYGIVILLSMIIIGVMNVIFNTFDLSLIYIVIAVVANTAAVIAVDGFFAWFVRWVLPQKLFDRQKETKLFKFENWFYKTIKIKKWKDKVLELGFLTSFSKKSVDKPNDEEYLKRFILECQYGIWVHIACVIFGFLIVFIYPLQYALMFAIPICVVNVVLNLLPIFILRYNLPKLQMALKRINRTKEKKEE